MIRKNLLILCSLLVLFACAYSAPAAYAQDAWESQHIGVGFKYLGVGEDKDFKKGALNLYGVNARVWTESKFGFEGGWLTWGESEKESYEGYSFELSTRIHMIPVSVLYTVAHVDAGGMYIRPYVGGGININRISVSGSVKYQEQSFSNTFSATKVGGQGFGGAEFTFKSLPQLSFGGDIGFHRIGIGDIDMEVFEEKVKGINISKFGGSFQVHYYFK